MNAAPLRTITALILAAIGLTAFVIGLNYEFGSARRMGSGYFPLVLSALLTILALSEAFSNFTKKSNQPEPSLDWRPLIAILSATAGFAVAIYLFGLIPAFIVVIGISTLSEKHYGLLPAAIVATSMSIGAWLLFSKLLGIALPLFKFGI